MIILISHYGNNKGTTDYFRDYLTSKGQSYIYIRNSLPNLEKQETIVSEFDGDGLEKVIKIKKTSKNFLINSIQTTLYSFSFSLKSLQGKDNLIISFGSVNALPIIFLKLFKRVNLYFWGVDYSTKRFNQYILDRFYQLTESLACVFSDLVIQPNIEQQNARIANNFLKLNKSLIVSNGITKIEENLNPVNRPISFLYFGSITQQHGICEFVKEVYINMRCEIPLLIFGGGVKSKELTDIIYCNKLGNKILFLGSTDNLSMVKYILTESKSFVGISPYLVEGSSDHVKYGDSLKVKEYLALSIPYITSSVAPIPSDLKEFGFVYTNYKELCNYITEQNLKKLIKKSQTANLNSTLHKYLWSELCKKIPLN